MLLVLSLGVVASTLFLRRARATADTAMLAVGATLSKSFHGPHARARQLLLNGNILTFSTRTVNASVERVIKAYERSCDDLDAPIPETSTAILSDRSQSFARAPLRLGSLAAESALQGSRGYVACLALGADSISLDELATRFARFARTANLGELGSARYVYAASVAGEGERAFVFEASANALDLRALLDPPPEGDAQFDSVPVPEGSAPILFAKELDAPSSVAIYSSSDPVDSILTHYERLLGSSGWRLLDVDTLDVAGASHRDVVVAFKRDQVALVLGSPSVSGRTVFTLLHAGTE